MNGWGQNRQVLLPLFTCEAWFSSTPVMRVTFPRPPGASSQPRGLTGGSDYSHSYGERHHITPVPCGIRVVFCQGSWFSYGLQQPLRNCPG